MVAPFFCTVAILTADLRMLGYPEIDDPQLLTTEGDSRIALLTWLAEQVDPTVQFTSADDVAKFWQILGIHSGESDGAGYIIPFTAPNRPRDRAAAFVYLRAAIDLVLAVRRHRGESSSPDWLDPDYFNESDAQGETGKAIETDSYSATAVNEFDQQALAQMDTLIARRHKLFPSSAQLLTSTPATRLRRLPLSTRSATSTNISGGSSPSKRPESVKRSGTTISTRSNSKSGTFPDTKPLAKSSSRVVSKPSPSPLAKSNSKPATKRTTSKMAGTTSTSLPTRDLLLDRLRTLRREIADFSANSARFTNSGGSPGLNDRENDSTKESIMQHETLNAAELAENALAVTSLARQFDTVVDDACTIRSARGRHIKRDVDMENSLTTAAPHCLQLAKSICSSLTMLSRTRAAVDALQRGRSVLRTLPGCTPVQRVVQQHLRTERHL